MIRIEHAELDLGVPDVGETPLLGDLSIRNPVQRHLRHGLVLPLVRQSGMHVRTGAKIARLRSCRQECICDKVALGLTNDSEIRRVLF